MVPWYYYLILHICVIIHGYNMIITITLFTIDQLKSSIAFLNKLNVMPRYDLLLFSARAWHSLNAFRALQSKCSYCSHHIVNPAPFVLCGCQSSLTCARYPVTTLTTNIIIYIYNIIFIFPANYSSFIANMVIDDSN